MKRILPLILLLLILLSGCTNTDLPDQIGLYHNDTLITTTEKEKVMNTLAELLALQPTPELGIELDKHDLLVDQTLVISYNEAQTLTVAYDYVEYSFEVIGIYKHLGNTNASIISLLHPDESVTWLLLPIDSLKEIERIDRDILNIFK